jgi:SAM-dependent methyltransferase
MNELKECTNCIVCGSGNASVLVPKEQLSSERKYLEHFWRQRFYPNTPDYLLKDHVFFSHPYESQLVACNKCGLVCRDPRWSPESAIQFFTHDEYAPEWLDAYFQPYCDSYLPEMPRLVKIVGRNARVLEVGSYVGGFLTAAKEYGWQAQSVDVGHRLSSFARSKGLDVFTGSLSEAHFPDDYFDAVFVWLCFEMIPDPWAELREIHRILSDGGWLFISVPNGDFIKLTQSFSGAGKLGSFRKYIWKVLAYALLLGFPFQFGYTPSSMSFLLKRSGFDNVMIQDQFYVPITSPDHVYPWVLPEKIRHLRLVHTLSQMVYCLSFHNLIKGPWIEVNCRKAMG